MRLDKSNTCRQSWVKRASQEQRTQTKGVESENSGVDFKWRMIEGKW